MQETTRIICAEVTIISPDGRMEEMESVRSKIEEAIRALGADDVHIHVQDFLTVEDAEG